VALGGRQTQLLVPPEPQTMGLQNIPS
jgi:hypothetical protein